MKEARTNAVERETLLSELDDWLEWPMLLLSFVWLALVLVELIWGEQRLLEVFGTAIWAIFIAEFALKLWLAPHKLNFVRDNLISLVALAAPALRVLRMLRFARALRGLRLVRVVGAANRGMRALKASMRRRGLGYVLVLSLLVLLLGAAGMFALEPELDSYAEALWWTSMLLASLGTDFWPQTAEGRVLCFLIALYGLGVFGYITASFASFFVGRDAAEDDRAVLRSEIAALRAAIARESG